MEKFTNELLETIFKGSAKLVELLGGGWEGVVAIGIIVTGLVVCFLCVIILRYLKHKSNNWTKLQIERIKHHYAQGGKK